MSNPHQFPNVRDKLSAPSKKSAFEKARLEAEEKRKREEAETAAVYKDFVASFNEGPSDAPPSSGFRGSFRAGGAGRRHFTGTRGPPPPPLPPPGLRKRGLGDAFERDEEEGGVFGTGALTEREKRRLKEGNSGLLAFENSGPAKQRRYHAAEDDSDSDTAAAHPKPTLLLSSLPPNITKAQITDLLSSTPLKLDSIRIIPAPPPPGPSQPSPSIRKAASALVTLSQETPISDIDAAVSALNGRYMGYGFWLGIARHLSSTAVVGSGIPILGTQVHPFGAKAPHPTAPRGRGFAPPTQLSRSAQQQQLQVHVQPPQDLKVLKLIHRTIEAMLTHGTEFEALLMSQESVRSDPKFAWLWDARSPSGVYYRWKLWEIVTGFAIDKPYTPTVEIFDSNAVWVPPKKPLKYEWASSLQDVVDDYEFMSDELDEGEDSDAGQEEKQKGYLGVLERAKLIHLVSRVPTTTSKVRRGDVGRVMAFAMEHAEGGMGEEVVQILVSNVLKPLAFTKAAKTDDDKEDGEDRPDPSNAKIVALWLISDVLSNSSLGVRAAWRYRQLFDTALREKKVFEHLGEIYRDSGWGRMKAEKFRRMVVEGVLEGWEKWCIFPQTTYDAFLNAFLHGPEKKEKKQAPETQSQKERSNTPTAPSLQTKSRWKTVEATPSVFDPKAQIVDEDIDGEPMVDEDIDGEPMMDDDIDGEPMKEVDDDDVDGEPMVEDPLSQVKKEDKVEVKVEEVEEKKPSLGFGGMTGFKMGDATAGTVGPKRKRPKAEDMFGEDYD